MEFPDYCNAFLRRHLYRIETLRIMRLTAFFLLAGFLHVSAGGYSQGKITLAEKDASLDKVFRDIQKQTGYYFIYHEEWLAMAKKVTLDVRQATIQDVLKLCFKDQPLTYNLVSNQIILEIKEKPQSNAPPTDPTHEIKGVVTGEDGLPISSATITVRGTNVVISANAKGEFTLNNVDQNATLIITSVGYQSYEASLKGRNNLSISLKKKIGQLDETLVIGYGTTTQRYNVGSVSKVTAEEISQQPVANPLAALEGRVPGLVVTQSSGLPGASFNIQIRGQNSLNPVNSGSVLFDNPLFIIDGVPFAPQNSNINQFSSIGGNGGIPPPLGGIGYSPFNSINPSDIESIEVLRDADATAIYGSRGANGVILITTKKGKAGTAKFGASVWTGESQVTRSMPMMNTQEYLTMRREALKNDGLTPSSNASNPGYAPDLTIFDTTQYTDWKKKFIGGTAHTTDANISLSGGTANTQFLIGAGYHREDYVYPGGFSDNRASTNISFTHNSIDKRLNLSFSANYSYENNNSASNTAALKSFVLAPNYPSLQNSDGTLNWNYKGFDLSDNGLAPLREPYSLKEYNLISSFNVGYKILPELTIRSSFGYNTLYSNEYSAFPLNAQDPASNPISSALFGTNNYQTWIIEPQAEFKKNIGPGKLDVLIGGTFQQNTNSSNAISGEDYTNDDLLGTISAAGVTSATDAYSLYKYNAIFGRLNYIIKNKYIINITDRKDGSSRFGPGKQFGNFQSIGGGWLFSEEQLIKKTIPALSYGKLHMSYGTTGNDDIGNYQYLSAYSIDQSGTYQNTRGYTPQNLYNPDFSWGITKKLEAGIELGFFKDHLVTSATWYQDRSGNQLVSYALPPQVGFTTVTQNAPYTVQNRGWEVTASTTNIKTRNFSWLSSINITLPKNILLSFPGLSTSPYYYTYVVGKSLSVLNKFVYKGVNDTTGVFEFETKKGVPTYKPATYTDYSTIGNLDQKFYGGFSNSFTYKGFQLNIFMQFVKQTGLNYLGQIYNKNVAGYYDNNLPTTFLSRWQNPGDNSDIQKFSTSFGNVYNAGRYFASSNAAYSDASYIRFKTISVSYALPTSYLSKLKIEACKLYLNAQNLFTLTGYKGDDPESQSFYSLPPLKTFVAGLQFTF
jgi:TonB-linked SusC/RagA family outer membrane protein